MPNCSYLQFPVFSDYLVLQGCLAGASDHLLMLPVKPELHLCARYSTDVTSWTRPLTKDESQTF